MGDVAGGDPVESFGSNRVESPEQVVGDVAGGDPVEQTSARMRALGLDHEVFDPAATHADLAQRIEQSAGLDGLLTETAGLDPTAFDPNWPACRSQPSRD